MEILKDSRYDLKKIHKNGYSLSSKLNPTIYHVFSLINWLFSNQLIWCFTKWPIFQCLTEYFISRLHDDCKLFIIRMLCQ